MRPALALPPPLSPADLARSLEVAGFAQGERFELWGIRKATQRKRVLWSDDPAAASSWATARAAEGFDLYLGTNPLRPDAKLAAGSRAKKADVARRRLLLVDLDPEKEAELDPQGIHPAKLERSHALALEVRAFCEAELASRPALVSSGRGRQLWLRIPAEVDDALAKRVVAAFARRFDVPGVVTVDRKTHDRPRLMRLPGSVNSKSGGRAEVLEPGDGRETPLELLQGFAPEKAKATGGAGRTFARSAPSRSEASPWTEAVLAATSIDGTLGLLGLAGVGQRGPCPIHGNEESGPNFAVYVRGGAERWTCHSRCGTGDAIHLVQGIRGIGRIEARRWLAERLGVAPPEDPRDRRLADAELPAFDSRKAPTQARGARIVQHKAHRRGEKLLLDRSPTGTGKSTDAGRASLTAPGLWVFAQPTHDLLTQTVEEELPRWAGLEGGEATLEESAGGFVYRARVGVGEGARRTHARLVPLACDPNQIGPYWASTNKRKMDELRALGENAGRVCIGCEWAKECNARRINAELAADIASGEVAQVYTTHARALASPAPGRRIVVDESVYPFLGSAGVVKLDELEAFGQRLEKIDRELVLDDDQELALLVFEVARERLARCFRDDGRAPLLELEMVHRQEAADALEWNFLRVTQRFPDGNRNVSRDLLGVVKAWAAGKPARVLPKREGGRVVSLTVLHWNELPDSVAAILDATGSVEVLRRFGVEVEEEVAGLTADALELRAGLEALQVTDAPGSKSRLVDGDRTRQELDAGARIVARYAAGRPHKRIGVLTHKGAKAKRRRSLERAFAEAGLEVAIDAADLHHGNLAGSNALAEVDGVVIDGGPAAPIEAIQALAVRLFPELGYRELCEALEAPRATHSALLEGQRVTYYGWAPATPLGIAWRILCLDPIEQAIGRATRGSKRAAWVLLLGDAPVSSVVDVKRKTAAEAGLDDRGEVLAILVGRLLEVDPDASLRRLAEALGLAWGRPARESLTEAKRRQPNRMASGFGDPAAGEGSTTGPGPGSGWGRASNVLTLDPTPGAHTLIRIAETIGIPIVELARELEVDARTIRTWASGHRSPHDCQALAAAVGCRLGCWNPWAMKRKRTR